MEGERNRLKSEKSKEQLKNLAILIAISNWG
jgi:hypothetical protein